MDLVLVAALGVVLWLALVAIAIALCRAASLVDERAEQAAGATPVARAEPPIGRRGVPVL